MVEERIDDGERIAEILVAELDGLEEGPLDRVSVDADDPTDVPSGGEGENGTDGVVVAVDGAPVATVRVHPERARLAFDAGVDPALEAAAEAGLAATASDGSSAEAIVDVETGAAAKRAVDVVESVAADLAQE